MAGYTRTDVTDNIANNKVANADDLDIEFNALQSAFNASTGHVHDGTSGNGAPITKVGPAQDVIISAVSVLPKTNNTLDLGSASLQFKDIWIDGTANIDSLSADTADINGGTVDATIIGATTPAAITGTTVTATTFNGTTFNGALTGNITSAGLSTFANADVNGGTIDATAIGVTTPASGKFTTVQSTGATTVGTTLGVTGATTLGTTLGVTGATTLSSTLDVTGAVTLSSTLNAAGAITGNLTGNVTGNVTGTASNATTAVTLTGLTSSVAELNFVDGVTSNVQTQLNTKAPSASPTLNTPTLSGAITVTGGTANWTATASGTDLTFAYGGVNKMRIDSSGNLTVVGNVTAYGTL